VGLMKKLTSALVASSLVFGLVGTAFANYSAQNVTRAATRMQTLGLIQGERQPDGSLDLVLNQTLTRAQLVTVIVRAWGQAETAKLLVGADSFPDAKNHPWASGEIALAKNIAAQNGFTLGYPDGTFKPEGTVTAAEAVALTNKFLGITPTAGLAWPMGDIQAALNAGIITADDRNTLAALPNIEANRGLAFYLADRAFSTYKLPNGKTVYTTYVDTTPPVVTVDSYTASTDKASITLTGTASGHSVLHVGFTGADVVTVAADGTWSATVALKAGENDIWVHALDVAGNATEVKGVKVTRVAGAVASIEATIADTMKAGAVADLVVVAKDSIGTEVKDPSIEVTVEGNIGSYDAATGKFTAATAPATGKIMIKSGEIMTDVAVSVVAGDLVSLAITSTPATTNVSAGTPLKMSANGVDAYGNTVAVSGVTWSATNGIIDSMGNFAATTSGTATVTATAGDISKAATITVFSAASKLAIANTKSLIANGSSTDTITVTVQDASGFTVSSYNENVTLAVVGNTTTLSINTTGSTFADTHTAKAVNGVATFTLKADGPALTANATGRLQATSGSLTGALKDITLLKPDLTSFVVTVDTSKIEANPAASAVIKVQAKDQDNVSTTATGSYTLTVASSDTTVLTVAGGANVAYANGFAGASSQNFTVNGTSVPGTASIVVTVKDANSNTIAIPVTTTSVSTAIAGAGATIQLIDGTISFVATDAATKTFKLAVLDAAGTVLTQASPVYTITVKDAAGADKAALFTIDQSAPAVSGVKSVTIVPSVSNSNAGTFTLGISSAGLAAASGAVTVTPAAGNSITMAVDNGTIAADAVSKVVLTAKVVDARNNPVAFNGNVTVKRTSGTSVALPSSVTVAAVNGVATFTLSATAAIGTSNFNVEADINGDGTVQASGNADVAVNTVLTGVATQVMFEDPNPAAKLAGESLTVKIHVKDGQGAPATVTSDNGRAVTLSITSGEGSIEAATVTTVNGVATFKVTATKAGALALKAEASGLTAATNGTATFNAVAAAKIVLKAAASNIQVGSDIEVTASWVDAYGNAVAGNPDLKTIAVTGSIGTIVATKGGAVTTTSNTGSFWLNATSIPASGTISAVDNAGTPLPVDSVSVSVYNAGLPYRAQIQSVANVTSDKISFMVKASITDFNGMVLTTYEGANSPVKLTVTKPAAYGGGTAGVVSTYVDGVVTFTYDIDGNHNAGLYTFKVEADAVGIAANGFTAQIADLFTNIQTTSTTATVTPHTATAGKVVAVIPSTGADSGATFDFDGQNPDVNVAVVKLIATDARGNVVTSFNGAGKFDLNNATNVTLVGADSNGVLNVNLSGGYATAQIQRAAGASSGDLTGSIKLDGTTDTAATTLVFN
jgi:adhesin/invasin